MFKKKYERILCVPDLHIPAHHKDSFKFLMKVKDKYQPDFVVFMGDIVDFHSISYHEHDPDLPSPGKELELVRKYVNEISEIFPEAVCLMGNHDKLIQRKILTVGLPKEVIKTLSEIINSPPGWDWRHEFKCNTPRGPVFFTHGKTQVINKLSQNMGMNTVQGHYHSKFYVSYYATPTGLFFDMNVGCLIDKDHPAISYGERLLNKPVLGCGVIKNGRAVLVPMCMRPGGKWRKKI